jgi:hypothetical protein
LAVIPLLDAITAITYTYKQYLIEKEKLEKTENNEILEVVSDLFASNIICRRYSVKFRQTKCES